MALTSPSAGARVGLVGGTGSGKSTTLDLLMGLSSQRKAGSRGWRADRGTRVAQLAAHHRPCTTEYLPADTRLAENIAFGVPRGPLTWSVRGGRGAAQIAEFIESRPRATRRWSASAVCDCQAGQRQRIGIARALYKRANVLVLDEATSALDNATEQSVMGPSRGSTGSSRSCSSRIADDRQSLRHDLENSQHGRVVAQGRTTSYSVQLDLSQMAHSLNSRIGTGNRMFNDKSILITGGTGSFGKQYVKTLLERLSAARS